MTVLNQRTAKEYCRLRGNDPRILNLDTSWKCVGQCNNQGALPRVQYPLYPKPLWL